MKTPKAVRTTLKSFKRNLSEHIEIEKIQKPKKEDGIFLIFLKDNYGMRKLVVSLSNELKFGFFNNLEEVVTGEAASLFISGPIEASKKAHTLIVGENYGY